LVHTVADAVDPVAAALPNHWIEPPPGLSASVFPSLARRTDERTDGIWAGGWPRYLCTLFSDPILLRRSQPPPSPAKAMKKRYTAPSLRHAYTMRYIYIHTYMLYAPGRILYMDVYIPGRTATGACCLLSAPIEHVRTGSNFTNARHANIIYRRASINSLFLALVYTPAYSVVTKIVEICYVSDPSSIGN